MSFEALTWAVKQNASNSGQKLVLLMLANYTNPDTGQCNPSQKRLAEKCCMSLASVKRHIDNLEEAGFLSVVNNYKNGSLVASQYELHLSSNCTNPQLNLSQPLAQSELQKHKEETKKETVKRATRLQDGFTVPDSWLQWARANRPDLDLKTVSESFVDFWISKPGVGGMKLDWPATWRNWIRNSKPGNNLSSKPNANKLLEMGI
jgi:DNA-binding MarR family transcriptional regulator